MEKIVCIKCLETITDTSTDLQADSESMEVSFFEDMRKSKILIELSDSKTICKSCKFWLENHYKAQILSAIEESSQLEKAILECHEQISELNLLPNLNDEDFHKEAKFIEESQKKIKEEIQDCEKELEVANQEYEKLLREEIEADYGLFTDYDNYLEIMTRTEVVTSEISFLSSQNLLFALFPINCEKKIGVINGMRFGRLDHELVHWDEINAAWGHTALLLSTLFRIQSFKSKSINLYPLGAHTRISYKKSDEKRHELFFSDYNFTNLITKFNKAQGLFLELFNEFESSLKDHGMPYTVTNESIGGFLIKFDPVHKEIWTQSLRFLLQDLKYLLHKLSS